MNATARLGWGLLTAIAALVACTGPLAPLARVDEAAAERLMRSSGLWDQLGSTAAGAHAGIEAGAAGQRPAIDAEELKRLLAAADAAFAAETLRGSVRRTLAERLKPDQVRVLDGWLKSALGKRITKLEVEATAPDRDSDRTIRAGVARLAAASGERRKLIDQVVTASRAAEAITNMTIHVAVAVQRGMAQVRPDQPAPPVSELHEAMAGQRAQFLQVYTGMTTALFAEMYATLSDAELGEYLDFLRGEAGRQFTEASMVAVERALVDAAERLGNRLPGARPGANT
jgi:hypothetical protein